MTFSKRLADDASLRDDFTVYLTDLVGEENSLDRVDGTRSLDYQRGMVAGFRRLIEKTRAMERKGDGNGSIR